MSVSTGITSRPSALACTRKHLRYLLMRGGRPAGPAPAAPALRRTSTGRTRLPENTAIEVDRVIGRDGVINFKGEQFPLSTSLAGQRGQSGWTGISCM
jgi:hypothetical protein